MKDLFVDLSHTEAEMLIGGNSSNADPHGMHGAIGDNDDPTTFYQHMNNKDDNAQGATGMVLTAVKNALSEGTNPSRRLHNMNNKKPF
jgi:hypothetical protein